MKIEIEGLEETIKTLRDLGQNVQGMIVEDFPDAMKPALELIQTYPPQKAPRNKNWRYIRGQGSLYVPTGKLYPTSQQYGPTTKSYAQLEAGQAVGYIHSPATYASYLRGDPPTYEFGTAYHRDNWMSITTILDRTLPQIADALDSRLSIRLARMFP